MFAGSVIQLCTLTHSWILSGHGDNPKTGPSVFSRCLHLRYNSETHGERHQRSSIFCFIFVSVMLLVEILDNRYIFLCFFKTDYSHCNLRENEHQVRVLQLPSYMTLSNLFFSLAGVSTSLLMGGCPIAPVHS